MEERTSPRGPHNLTFGSLFAGVGGFDLGFEAAGWTPRWQVEWDARCRSVLERHWPQVARYGDVCDVVGSVSRSRIRTMDTSQAQRHGDDPPRLQVAEGIAGLEPVDLITYGFPCQDLSTAGRRAGLDGNRSGLFFEAARIIKEMRDASGGRYPTWAVAENVPGLLSADGGAAMGRCLDTLADIGAVGIEWAVLDAQHFGVPQRRKRVFLVAWWDPRISSVGEILPVATRCGGDHQTSDAPGEEVAGSVAYGLGKDRSVAGTIGSRMRTTDLDSVGAFVKARRAQSEDDYETWEAGRPAPTLNAFDNGTESRATVLVDGVRRLTPRECERLMGWPDDHTRWAADGTEIADTNRYKMCGNGVVAPVAEWVANRLLDAHPTAG